MSTGPSIRTLSPGEYLCFQGNPSNEMFVLKTGKLEVYLNDASGVVSREKVESEGMLVGIVDSPNSFTGEIGAILREPRSASIKAIDESQIMVIDLHGQGFDGSILQNPKLGLNMSKTIATRLAQASGSLTKSQALCAVIKGHIDNFANKFFNAFSSIEKAAVEAAVELPLIADAKNTIAYQLGRVAAPYGTLPVEIHAAMDLPFKAHTNIFSNRIYKGGGAPANVEVPSGPPKPGVDAFEPGAVVCKEGAVDDKMFILLAGKLEVVVGGKVIETVAGKGSIFGEMAMFGDMPRSSGIRAVTDVHAMPVPKDKIEPFLMGKPPVMLHVLKSFAKRLPLLNEALLDSARQMTSLINLMNTTLAAFEAIAPRTRAESGALAAAIGLAISELESSQQALTGIADQTNNDYIALCQEIGYRPKTGAEIEVKPRKFNAPSFPFIAKFEDIESLDSEHLTFVVNPKNDLFRACSIEFNHLELLAIAKVSKDTYKDMLFGRIYNSGDTFPAQFLSFDTTAGGAAKHDKEYVIRALKIILAKMEQEIFAIYDATGAQELCYIPDYIKSENEELVDENTILEFIEKFKKEPDNRENLEKLNSLYWDLIVATVQKKLPKVKDTTVPLDDTERALINFGLLDVKFLPDNSNVLAQIEEDKTFKPNEEAGLRYVYLEDIIQDVYKEAFGFNKQTKLQADLRVCQMNLKEIQDRIGTLANARVDMINSFPNGNAAVAFVQKLDALLKTMATLDLMMKTGRQLSTEQRGQIVSIKNTRTSINNQLTAFFTAIKGRVSEEKVKEFRDYGEEYEKKCMEVLISAEVLAAKEAEVKQHETDMKNITLKAKEATYKNEIVRLKKFVVLTAKKCGVDPTAVLVGVRDIATKKRVAEIIELFTSEIVDPDIFDPKLPRIKKMGKPDIMLVPGSGVSVYDWEKHMFIVPLTPPKTLEESIANAFVEFHWDMDEDKTLRESYGDLKINKGLSITKLKLQLAKDYIVWATKESKNWKVLDKEVRAWFLVKIAHGKVSKEG